MTPKTSKQIRFFITLDIRKWNSDFKILKGKKGLEIFPNLSQMANSVCKNYNIEDTEPSQHIYSTQKQLLKIY